MSNQRYPLDWPQGYARIAYRPNNSKPLFKPVSLTVAVALIESEIRKLLGKNKLNETDVVISSNVPLRNDGYPRADYLRSIITDPGVAVYFNYNKEPVVLCCDKFSRIEDNMKAIAVTIEDMRRIERNGVSDFIKRSFTGFKALPPGGRKWYEVLGFDIPPLSFAPVRIAYIDLSKLHHPDTGGDQGKFQEIGDAYTKAKKYYEL